MDKEQQIKSLQEKIARLSKDLDSFQQQLQSLQSELNALQGNDDRTGYKSQAKTNDSGLENYIGLRFMHIVGIVVLVIGLSIGVKYAIDKQLISEGMRIGLAYLAGALLFTLSVWLKKKYQLFSAILFSGSMASVYFTTYAAFVYYGFFPIIVAFSLMIGLTIYTVVTAISYNRQEIAILGMIGAYGIPFLISANADRVDLFLSYILLINIGVAFISFRKSWKWMQYLALLITWILFIGWELMRYNFSQQLMGMVFLSCYYFLFLISAIARRITMSGSLLTGEVQQVAINNIAFYIAALLLFGNGDFDINLAGTTGFISLFIGILALTSFFVFPSENNLQRLLAWQAVVLVVAFIGLRWNGVMVTLLWVVMAVVLFLWGIYTKRSWPRLASILLIGFTLVKLIAFDSAKFSTLQKIASFLIIGVLLLLFSFYYQKFNLSNNKPEGKQE